jgi:hypothetical protein
MANVLSTMAGSVSRSVYSQFRRQGCTLFAHADGRRRTVVVRNATGVAAMWLVSAAKGLKTVGFVEMASFLLSQ